MPGDGERYDVVVVGVAGGDAAGADLAAELSALTGLSAAKVSLTLRNGELIAHRSLGEGEARRVASALRRLGADVQIRSIADGPPDIDAMLGGAGLLLPHAGGTPAPIAPPPEFAGAARARSIEVGARPSARPALLDPSRPQGRLADPQSERPFAGAFEKAAGRARPTPRDVSAREPVRSEPGNGEPKKVRDNYVGTPRRSKPESRRAAGQIADAERLAASLEAAAASAEAIEVVTLDGESSESVEIKLGSPPGDAAEAPRAASRGADDARAAADARRPEAAPRRAGPIDERVVLDFQRSPARAEQSAAASSSNARAEAATGGAFAASSVSGAARPATLRGAQAVHGSSVAARRLFSADPLANALFGVAVGLAIGIVFAFVAVRVFVRADVLALEEELAVSYAKPTHVDRGDARRSTAILDDLEAAYGRSRWLFMLTMILVGVPAGLGLGTFKR